MLYYLVKCRKEFFLGFLEVVQFEEVGKEVAILGKESFLFFSKESVGHNLQLLLHNLKSQSRRLLLNLHKPKIVGLNSFNCLLSTEYHSNLIG